MILQDFLKITYGQPYESASFEWNHTIGYGLRCLAPLSSPQRNRKVPNFTTLQGHNYIGYPLTLEGIDPFMTLYITSLSAFMTSMTIVVRWVGRVVLNWYIVTLLYDSLP